AVDGCRGHDVEDVHRRGAGVGHRHRRGDGLLRLRGGARQRDCRGDRHQSAEDRPKVKCRVMVSPSAGSVAVVPSDAMKMSRMVPQFPSAVLVVTLVEPETMAMGQSGEVTAPVVLLISATSTPTR